MYFARNVGRELRVYVKDGSSDQTSVEIDAKIIWLILFLGVQGMQGWRQAQGMKGGFVRRGAGGEGIQFPTDVC